MNRIKITKSEAKVVNTLPKNSSNRNIIFKYQFSKPLKSDKIVLYLQLEYILLNGKLEDIDNIAGSLKLNTSFTIHSEHNQKDSILLLYECTRREIEHFISIFNQVPLDDFPREKIYIPSLSDCEPILNELFYLDLPHLS